MIPEMYFIYSLSCEGQIYYIGKTKDLATRYSSHLSTNEALNVSKYTAQLKSEGKQIMMNYIAYLPAKEAGEKEMKLILDLTKAGQKLQNSVFVWQFHKHDKIPPNLSRKDMMKFLRFIQGSKEYAHAYNIDLPGWDQLEYPDYPFENIIT